MTEKGEEKRQINPWLKTILQVDISLSKRFVIWGNSFAPLHSLRMHYKALEMTCHGIPWLAFWTAFTWLFNKPHLVQLQVNMLLALFLDIFIVAITKATFRRRRPIGNKPDAFAEMASDKFSFPSGHCSRAVMVVFIFIFLWPVSIFFYPPMMAWVVALGLSRILMERHYILDIVGGYTLGLLEGLLVAILWISEENSKWLFNIVSDEKLEGGEFHV